MNKHKQISALKNAALKKRQDTLQRTQQALEKNAGG